MAGIRGDGESTMQTSLRTLKSHIEKVGLQVAELRKRCDELESENRELHRELEQEREVASRLTTDVEFLTLSHRMADNPQALADSRRHIARLIRNLDTCISLLKE